MPIQQQTMGSIQEVVDCTCQLLGQQTSQAVRSRTTKHTMEVSCALCLLPAEVARDCAVSLHRVLRSSNLRCYSTAVCQSCC